MLCIFRIFLGDATLQDWGRAIGARSKKRRGSKRSCHVCAAHIHVCVYSSPLGCVFWLVSGGAKGRKGEEKIRSSDPNRKGGRGPQRERSLEIVSISSSSSLRAAAITNVRKEKKRGEPYPVLSPFLPHCVNYRSVEEDSFWGQWWKEG